MKRPLAKDTHAAWQILHGILAYRDHFTILADGRNQPAIEYLISGGEISGWSFSPGDTLPNGRIGLRTHISAGTYAGQGHTDQWLAVLAQCGLSVDQELVVKGKPFLIKDLLDQALLDVSNNVYEEWSWTLIAVTQFLPTTSVWVADDGEQWSAAKLVELEMNQGLAGSACGGSHRLIGIAMALEKRRREAAPMTGIWQEAERYVAEAAQIARQYQNGDGSFSNNYFSRTGISTDTAKTLASTGHTLEFLALTLSPEELKQPWVTRAVNRLCTLLENAEDYPLECGALYHAVHGLQVFLDRTGS